VSVALPEGAPPSVRLDPLGRALIEGWQRGFPLVPRPYARIAEALGVHEHLVIATLARLQRAGVVTRVGPVFRPGTAGASMLAAAAVPPARLEQVAACVSAFPEVNHNYEREHRLNLWFVVTGPDRERIEAVVSRIETRCGVRVLRLPMERDYHIDLAFPLWRGARGPGAHAPEITAPRPAARPDPALVAAVQRGIPLLARPYAHVAAALGRAEAEVIATLERWLADGVLSRFGIVVRHHELGWRANAMVVWDVPDGAVDLAGERLARHPAVTLCYRRPRVDGVWPYNLYCMVHGRERATVRARVAELARLLPPGTRHEVLFSRRRFKQRGALYALRPSAVGPAGEEAHGGRA